MVKKAYSVEIKLTYIEMKKQVNLIRSLWRPLVS